MASIRLKPNSKYYVACYTDKQGIQRQKSTKTADKKLAAKIADAWEAPYRDKRTVTQLRKTFSGIAEEIGTKLNLSLSVREYFNRWLQEIRGETGAGTYTRYKQIVRDSLHVLGAQADQPLDELDRSAIIQLRQAIAERSSARNSNIYLKVLRRVFRASVDDGVRSDDPTRKIRFLDEEEPDRAERRPFTEDELRRLRAVLTGEWRVIVHFGEHTGQRLGDIASCTREQLDLAAHIWVFDSDKTNRTMRVPLTPSLLAVVHEITPVQHGGPIFPMADATMRKSNGQARRLSGQFRHFLEIAGLVPKRSKRNTGRGHGHRRSTSELSFHCLRHNATSNLKAAGVPEAVVRDIIGHESPLISRRYTHIDDNTKVAAVARIDIQTAAKLEKAS
jgi:integrase